ncbi:MAG: hypothetical protein ACR2LN_05160, partial [Candidatus Levyibacteriota bacterium]
GIVVHLRGKVASSQRKQTKLIQSLPKQSSYQVASKTLSKLDWMEILWNGLEDSLQAKNGTGWITSIGVGILGGMFGGMFFSAFSSSAAAVYLIIFYVSFFSIHLLFYIYFVGRRIEKKIEDINQP